MSSLRLWRRDPQPSLAAGEGGAPQWSCWRCGNGASGWANGKFQAYGGGFGMLETRWVRAIMALLDVILRGEAILARVCGETTPSVLGMSLRREVFGELLATGKPERAVCWRSCERWRRWMKEKGVMAVALASFGWEILAFGVIG